MGSLCLLRLWVTGLPLERLLAPGDRDPKVTDQRLRGLQLQPENPNLVELAAHQAVYDAVVFFATIESVFAIVVCGCADHSMS